MRNRNHYLPWNFAKDSLAFMKGTMPTWEIWLKMPLAYGRMLCYGLLDLVGKKTY